jgi:kinesin family member 6/9
MGKQSVKVVIRTRPTSDFASKVYKIDAGKGTIALSADKRPEDGTVNN